MITSESYPGSKAGAGVWQRIISLMPAHENYFEPFLGHGIVLRSKRRAPGLNVGCDVDAGVVDWWRQRPQSPWMTILQEDALRIPSLFPEMMVPPTLVYLDPPYLLSTRTRLVYRSEFCTVEEHLALLQMIKSLKCLVMISVYTSRLYDRELDGWHSVSYRTMTRGGHRRECLWMNFPAGLPLHDVRFVGEGFRERERIKRKRDRWTSRLLAMPVAERQVIREALAAVD